MLVKFDQSIGSVPDAGVTDRGKPNVYTYPGRKIARVKVEDAVSNPTIVQNAREAQFTSTHMGMKEPETYTDLGDEKRERDKRHSTAWHGAELKPRTGGTAKARVGGVGSATRGMAG